MYEWVDWAGLVGSVLLAGRAFSSKLPKQLVKKERKTGEMKIITNTRLFERLCVRASVSCSF